MTDERFPLPTEDVFEASKTAYFSELAARQLDALRLHRAEGLWELNEKGERDWGNVSQHCLVETARAQVFSELMGFDEELSHDLMAAAAVHDYFKKSEKQIMEERGLSWDSYSLAGARSKEKMQASGLSGRTVKIAASLGHETVPEMRALLEKPEPLGDEDLACLILHYIDDYTIQSDWAAPATTEDGHPVNDLDKRIDNNEANPRYAVLKQEGKAYFDGQTSYEAQRQTGHDIQERLATLLSMRLVTLIRPVDLPSFIDDRIREKITARV